MAARTMVGRNGELDDFPGVATFLASRASGYLTGLTLFVDGASRPPEGGWAVSRGAAYALDGSGIRPNWMSSETWS
jgi:hypothetical protein